jgi:hypothetical protein
MRRFFNFLAFAMIALIAVAAFIFADSIIRQQGVTQVSHPVEDSNGQISTTGLPAEFANFLRKGREEEDAACQAADEARSASKNAEDEAVRANNAADETGHAEFHTDDPAAQGGPGHYTGQAQGKAREGRGVENFDSGAIYRGDWEADKFDQLGVFTSPAGGRYEGHYNLGARSKGVLFQPDGENYWGQWDDKNQPSGVGILTGSQNDAFAELLGRFNDLEPSPVVVRYKNGDEWVLVLKSSGSGASANKSDGYCIELDGKTQIPKRAGSCLGNGTNANSDPNMIHRLNSEPEMTTVNWPRNPSDKSGPFPRSAQCTSTNF